MLKNDPVASRRRLPLRITNDTDGTAAPRGTSFAAASWIDQSTGNLVATNNAPVNMRRELVFTTFTFTADPATDICTAVGHGMETGDGLVRPSSTGTLPAGIAAATSHWLIVIDADHFKLATSLANAYAGTAINITDAGTGVHSIPYSFTFLSQRGLDGDFYLQLEQAETNFDGDYAQVLVSSGGYTGRSFVKMENAGGVWDDIMEAGHTFGDGMRIIVREMAAKFSKVGNDYVTRDLADTKDSHSGTVTAGGRIAAAILDPT
jgi:hypothetical protein